MATNASARSSAAWPTHGKWNAGRLRWAGAASGGRDGIRVRLAVIYQGSSGPPASRASSSRHPCPDARRRTPDGVRRPAPLPKTLNTGWASSSVPHLVVQAPMPGRQTPDAGRRPASSAPAQDAEPGVQTSPAPLPLPLTLTLLTLTLLTLPLPLILTLLTLTPTLTLQP